MQRRFIKKDRRLGMGIWQNLSRRHRWFSRRLSPGTAANMSRAFAEFALGRTRLTSLPIALKVDISPICNLRCPFCVHGEGGVSPNGEGSRFHKGQRMKVENFQRLVDDVKGKTSAFSLFYLGDPFTHPDLLELCDIADRASIYTHVSSNFSFNFRDEKIEAIVASGMSHLKICLDGISQEKYALTRTGGSVERVLSNIKRVCDARERTGRRGLTIEVQYLVHDGNRDELTEAESVVSDLGVDEMTSYSAASYSMDQLHPDNYEVEEFLERSGIANCYWPWLFATVKWDGDVIPCCSHRQAEQYDPSIDDMRTMGNIFDNGIAEVWNSPSYRKLRELTRSPKLTAASSDVEGSFCYGCSKVCQRRERDILETAA